MKNGWVALLVLTALGWLGTLEANAQTVGKPGECPPGWHQLDEVSFQLTACFPGIPNKSVRELDPQQGDAGESLEGESLSVTIYRHVFENQKGLASLSGMPVKEAVNLREARVEKLKSEQRKILGSLQAALESEEQLVNRGLLRREFQYTFSYRPSAGSDWVDWTGMTLLTIVDQKLYKLTYIRPSEAWDQAEADQFFRSVKRK